MGALNRTALDCLGGVVDLVEGFAVGCDSSLRGSAGCFPSRATGLPVELSCDAALILATWVEPGLVVAVSVEVGS